MMTFNYILVLKDGEIFGRGIIEENLTTYPKVLVFCGRPFVKDGEPEEFASKHFRQRYIEPSWVAVKMVNK